MIYPKKKPAMVQLNGNDGKPQAKITGDSRIYSREDSKRIISLAKLAKTKSDLVELGKFVAQATKLQDSRKPEYVDQ